MALSNIEMLAVAVLQGDEVAKHNLFDALAEEYGGGAKEIKASLRSMKVPVERLKFIIYIDDDHQPATISANAGHIREALRNWLEHDGADAALVVRGVNRIEAWQFPEEDQ